MISARSIVYCSCKYVDLAIEAHFSYVQNLHLVHYRRYSANPAIDTTVHCQALAIVRNTKLLLTSLESFLPANNTPPKILSVWHTSIFKLHHSCSNSNINNLLSLLQHSHSSLIISTTMPLKRTFCPAPQRADDVVSADAPSGFDHPVDRPNVLAAQLAIARHKAVLLRFHQLLSVLFSVIFHLGHLEAVCSAFMHVQPRSVWGKFWKGYYLDASTGHLRSAFSLPRHFSDKEKLQFLCRFEEFFYGTHACQNVPGGPPTAPFHRGKAGFAPKRPISCADLDDFRFSFLNELEMAFGTLVNTLAGSPSRTCETVGGRNIFRPRLLLRGRPLRAVFAAEDAFFRLSSLFERSFFSLFERMAQELGCLFLSHGQAIWTAIIEPEEALFDKEADTNLDPREWLESPNLLYRLFAPPPPSAPVDLPVAPPPPVPVVSTGSKRRVREDDDACTLSPATKRVHSSPPPPAPARRAKRRIYTTIRVCRGPPSTTTPSAVPRAGAFQLHHPLPRPLLRLDTFFPLFPVVKEKLRDALVRVFGDVEGRNPAASSSRAQLTWAGWERWVEEEKERVREEWRKMGILDDLTPEMAWEMIRASGFEGTHLKD